MSVQIRSPACEGQSTSKRTLYTLLSANLSPLINLFALLS